MGPQGSRLIPLFFRHHHQRPALFKSGLARLRNADAAQQQKRGREAEYRGDEDRLWEDRHRAEVDEAERRRSNDLARERREHAECAEELAAPAAAPAAEEELECNRLRRGPEARAEGGEDGRAGEENSSGCDAHERVSAKLDRHRSACEVEVELDRAERVVRARRWDGADGGGGLAGRGGGSVLAREGGGGCGDAVRGICGCVEWFILFDRELDGRLLSQELDDDWQRRGSVHVNSSRCECVRGRMTMRCSARAAPAIVSQ
jgi:hypothetical protein